MSIVTKNKLDTPSAQIEAYFTWETALVKFSDLGFDHLPVNVPPPGEWIRVPSAYKNATNTSAAVILTEDGKAVHLYDHVEGCCHTVQGERVSDLSAVENGRRLVEKETKRSVSIGEQLERVETGTTHDRQPFVNAKSRAMEKRRRIAEQEKRRVAAEAERREKAEKGIANARRVFDNASPCTQHPYLCRKNVVLPNCRTDGYWLLVPLTDIDGDVQSLQRIAPDGTKRLLANAPLKGAAYRIGSIETTDTVYVTEGAATGGSVHNLTGSPVVCSMSAGNLTTTAIDIRNKYPNVIIVIAGDDDQQSHNNVGRTKAIEAADAVNGYVLFPYFCDSCNGSCSDHNDVANCKRKKS